MIGLGWCWEASRACSWFTYNIVYYNCRICWYSCTIIAGIIYNTYYCSSYGGDRSKISRVLENFSSMDVSLMRFDMFLLDARPDSPDRRAPVAPQLRPRARNEGPNPIFGLAHPVSILVLIILMCGEPRSDILAHKRNGWNQRSWFYGTWKSIPPVGRERGPGTNSVDHHAI